jgi:PhnB protein
MQISAYLNFNGDCREAFEFYEKATGGKILMMTTFDDSPADMNLPPDWGDKIIHARMQYGNTLLMGSDAPPGRQSKPAGFGISLNVDSPADAERVFNALSEGAEVHMPISETFFAHRFGMLKDRYGMPWMVIAEKPMGG